MKPEQKPKTEMKNVRHNFTVDERNNIGADLARQFGYKRGLEAEFDQIKASFKSKIAEADAKIDRCSTSLLNGFEMREKKCVVQFDTKNGKKFYFLEDTFDQKGVEPVAVEDMTKDDYNQDLIEAEKKFELREEHDLFQAVNNDSGVIVVGRFANRWFTALRIEVGGRKLIERLDSEQKAMKRRCDAIKGAAGRAQTWLADNLGDEAAKGFKDGIVALVDSQKEREE